MTNRLRSTFVCLAVAGGALLAGCARAESEPEGNGAAATAPDASPGAPSRAPDPTAANRRPAKIKEISDLAVGHLEHPARLVTFFSRLQGIEKHDASSDVRVAQFGDSHTASDYGTSVARARLAARFGDGGRGFLPMGAPYKRLFQAGEGMARSNGFAPDEVSLGKGTHVDGRFGPLAMAMDSRKGGATMASELSAKADSYEIAYLTQPNGGSFDVIVDGHESARVSTRQAAHGSEFRLVDVARGPHTLEVRALGDGAVRIFGVRLDDKAVGVTLDSFGMNGAKATTPLAIDEAHFGEQMAHMAPALVIVAYGTNEAGDSITTPDDHTLAIRTLVERARKGSKGAECLVLGPPDRGAKVPGGARTLTKVAEIIAAQKRAADAAGCAFYDQFAAMGGADTLGRWASESPPRARRDYVHLTRAGYAFLAEALVADLLAAYDGWKGAGALAFDKR